MRALLTATVAILLVASGCGSDEPETATVNNRPLMKAQYECNGVGTTGDDSRTIILSSEEDGIADLACAWLVLDMPTSVVAQIEQTRALDGTREADWATFHASWTYHPDNGLNMVITDSGGEEGKDGTLKSR